MSKSKSTLTGPNNAISSNTNSTTMNKLGQQITERSKLQQRQQWIVERLGKIKTQLVKNKREQSKLVNKIFRSLPSQAPKQFHDQPQYINYHLDSPENMIPPDQDLTDLILLKVLTVEYRSSRNKNPVQEEQKTQNEENNII